MTKDNTEKPKFFILFSNDLRLHSLIIFVLIAGCILLTDSSAYWQISECNILVKNENPPFTGSKKHYFEEGTILYELNYKNEVLDGSNTVYRKDGSTVCEIVYEDGQWINTIHYDESNQPQKISNTEYTCFFNRALPQSLMGQDSWGSFRKQCNQNQPEGVNYCFNKEIGEIVYEWNCLDYQLHGSAIEYYELGRKRREYILRKGKVVEMMHYNLEGQKIGQYSFDPSLLRRIKSEEYYDNGQLKKRSQFKIEKDTKEGLCCEYVEEFSSEGTLINNYYFRFDKEYSPDGCGGQQETIITRKITKTGVEVFMWSQSLGGCY